MIHLISLRKGTYYSGQPRLIRNTESTPTDQLRETLFRQLYHCTERIASVELCKQFANAGLYVPGKYSSLLLSTSSRYPILNLRLGCFTHNLVVGQFIKRNAKFWGNRMKLFSQCISFFVGALWLGLKNLSCTALFVFQAYLPLFMLS